METSSERLRRISRKKRADGPPPRRDSASRSRPERPRTSRRPRGDSRGAPQTSWVAALGRGLVLRAIVGFVVLTVSLISFAYRDASQRDLGAQRVEQWTD